MESRDLSKPSSSWATSVAAGRGEFVGRLVRGEPVNPFGQELQRGGEHDMGCARLRSRPRSHCLEQALVAAKQEV
jgi:hypothetical protein